MANIPEISHDDLKRIFEDGQVVLVDCNGTQTFQQMHIPGAIDFEAEQNHLNEVLPPDSFSPIVVYCGSEQCHAWEKCAEGLEKAGFTNLLHYAPGIKGWAARGEKIASAEIHH